ncbi:MAG: GlsB/YeaQ/YmgE family stress response membrane protein [Bacteroidales bacterium]|nr:GlsB/YeaQ/YmgE family stress response membrane protein [Bacteroidales bacterium]
MGFLIQIILGILAGFVASKLFNGKGSGLILNLVLGICGSLLGGWIYGLFFKSATSGFMQFIIAVLGAVLILWIFKKIRK